MEDLFKILGSVALAAIVTLVADFGFEQHWNFFLVWLLCLVCVYGGFFIGDLDGDLW